MSEPFYGEIRITTYSFPHAGWASCDGQVIAINQNSALASLLGNIFGGDGTTNFALPDLRGRMPIGQGQAPGGNNYVFAQRGGAESVALGTNQLPAHTHTAYAVSAAGDTASPSSRHWAGSALAAYSTNTATLATMGGNTLSATGGNVPHENRMPFLALNYQISLQGIWPNRP